MFNITFIDYNDEKNYLYNVTHENAKIFSDWYYNQSENIEIHARNGDFIVKSNSVKSILVERIG